MSIVTLSSLESKIVADGTPLDVYVIVLVIFVLFFILRQPA